MYSLRQHEGRQRPAYSEPKCGADLEGTSKVSNFSFRALERTLKFKLITCKDTSLGERRDDELPQKTIKRSSKYMLFVVFQLVQSVLSVSH